MTNTELMQVQIELEQDMFDGGVSRFNSEQDRHISSGNASDTAWHRRLLSEFIEPMTVGMQEYKEKYQGSRGKPSRALSILSLLSNEVAAYITMKCAIDMLHMDVTYNAIAMTIADRVEDQIRFAVLENSDEKTQAYVGKVLESLKKNSSKKYLHGHNVLVSAERTLSEREGSQVKRWEGLSLTDKGATGLALLQIMEMSVFFDGENVFKRVTRTSNNKDLMTLEISEKVGGWVQAFREHVSVLAPAFAPCVVQPRDWLTPFDGGYYSEKVSSRVQLVKGRRKHVRRLHRKQMPKVYEAINFLQSVQWQVNPDILSVAEDVAAGNLGLGMPSYEPVISRTNKPDCPIPAEFAHLRGAELKEALQPDQWEEFLTWKSGLSSLYTMETKRTSQAAAVTRVLGTARKYKDFNAIYFVYTMDSRQRVYSLSSTISPQGNDLSKAMLRFTEQQPLASAEDLKWFLITGANLWGWDKKKFAERQFNATTEEFQEMVRDITSDPISFKQWLEADEPWEFLAWAFEYSRYLDLLDDGRQDEFLTQLPCHQDGTCSGIQHYSAMMRDTVGAKAVNLYPSDAPQDIYREVSNVTAGKNDKYAAGGIEFTSGKTELSAEITRLMAESWVNIGIVRGLTKKPVMTLPYGSSRITCREAVAAYLTDLEDSEAKLARAQGRKPNMVHPFGKGKDDKLKWNDSLNYMTSLIWPSISEVVRAPVVAMKFIKKVTARVSAMNQGLYVTAPTGFIMEQRILVEDNLIVSSYLMGRIQMSVNFETDMIDVTAMKGAAAPNFVHLHDASHLVLAVCNAKAKGINSIAVIHDSFGAHAGRTPDLRDSLRAEMVGMYDGTNRLQSFLDEQEDNCLTDLGLTVPEQGDFDVKLILESEYAFA